MPVFGHAHGVPHSPPVTVAQHLYLARYISSDADGGFATVGLGAHDRWVQERDGGSSIPDVGIGVVVAASTWYPELANGGVAVELIEPSGRTIPLNEVEPTPSTGAHHLRVTTTLGGPAGQPPSIIVSEVELHVHPPGTPADAQRHEPPPDPGLPRLPVAPAADHPVLVALLCPPRQGSATRTTVVSRCQ